jgi:2-polyprenyl-3-methyl-5-hydroxy-6-metoxy-1,4-benzoquinol methylase
MKRETPTRIPLGESAERLNVEPRAKAGARILDVGCGTGYFTCRCAQQGYDVVGIDLDPRMLATRVRIARDAKIIWWPMRAGCHFPTANSTTAYR